MLEPTSLLHVCYKYKKHTNHAPYAKYSTHASSRSCQLLSPWQFKFMSVLTHASYGSCRVQFMASPAYGGTGPHEFMNPSTVTVPRRCVSLAQRLPTAPSCCCSVRRGVSWRLHRSSEQGRPRPGGVKRHQAGVTRHSPALRVPWVAAFKACASTGASAASVPWRLPHERAHFLGSTGCPSPRGASPWPAHTSR